MTQTLNWVLFFVWGDAVHRNATSLYSRALPYLQYADAAHADTSRGAPRIRVGIAISAPCSENLHSLPAVAQDTAAPVVSAVDSRSQKPPQPPLSSSVSPPCNPASWQTRSETEMAALMALACRETSLDWFLAPVSSRGILLHVRLSRELHGLNHAFTEQSDVRAAVSHVTGSQQRFPFSKSRTCRRQSARPTPNHNSLLTFRLPRSIEMVSPGSDVLSFLTRSLCMPRPGPDFEKHPSFGGWAVFHGGK